VGKGATVQNPMGGRYTKLGVKTGEKFLALGAENPSGGTSPPKGKNSLIQKLEGIV